MTPLTEWLALNWLPAAAALLGLLAGLGAWLRHRRAGAGLVLAHLGGALLLAAAGAWLLSDEAGWWVFGLAGGAMVLAFGVLIATSAWSPHLARVLAGTAAFGLGAAVAEDARASLEEAGRVVRSLEVVE